MIAWQMLHAELRRRMRPDNNGPVYPSDVFKSEHLTLDPEVERFAALYQQARAAGISGLHIMAELAGFAATFAQMTRNPVGVAQQVSRSVAGGRLTIRPSLARLVITL